MVRIGSLFVLPFQVPVWRCLAVILLLAAAMPGQAQGFLLRQLATGELDYLRPATPTQTGLQLRVDDLICTTASGCANNWRFVGSNLAVGPYADLPGQVVWFDPVAGSVNVSAYWGEVAPDGSDAVHLDTPVALSWTCTAASGCATQWKIVGTGSFDPFQLPGVLWFNAGTGQLGAWVAQSAGVVLGTVTVNLTCGPGCSDKWVPVATGDFDGDHHTDILWYDKNDGLLAIWYLDGTGTVSSRFNLSWTCDASCSSSWKIVGSADFDGDGKDDIVWWNQNTGQVGYWKVGASGTVLGAAGFSTLCVLSWGCEVETVLKTN